MVGLTVAACQSLDAYEGPKRGPTELAVIRGDLRISAGEPMSVILRRVGNSTLGWLHNGVKVPPGQHDVLIDCTVTESREVSRHHLTVEVEAGKTYRFVADTAPGNRECANVRLIEVN